MYFSLKPMQTDPDFSYIISKHPDSVFDRDTGNGRNVFAKYVTLPQLPIFSGSGEEDKKETFEGHIENDPLTFLHTARQLNLSNYVHVQLSAVCPHNLKGFDKCFQTVLRGKNGTDITDERFFAPKMLEAGIGPFPKNFAFIQKIFESVQISAKICIDEINPVAFEDPTEYKNAYMLHLTTVKPMSVTEFLQKMYLISYYATSYYSLTKISTEQVEKFIKFCEKWLDTCEYRNGVINTLCKRNKDLVAKFETQLINLEPNEEQRAIKLTKFNEWTKRERLHEKRHAIVLKCLEEFEDLESVIDLGCGSGILLRKISKRFENLSLLGLEAHPLKAQKARFQNKKAIKIMNANILVPNIEDSYLQPDFLTLIEVIEHMEEKDRKRILELINNFFQPQELILTAPNRDYNVEWGLKDGEMRHPDHRIEYSPAEFAAEVEETLSKNYTVKYLSLIEGDKQPSFVIHCVRHTERKSVKNIKYNLQNMYHSVYLEGANYRISPKELSNGYASHQILLNSRNIFYLAPTIAPVDFNRDYPDYLEHPLSALNYYRERGIKEVVAEKKYMGSRGYILAFKNPEQAAKLGFAQPIIINSRNGFPFFREDNTPLEIWESMREKMTTDFIMLDCEVLPWTLKAKGLIKREFETPGQCAYLSRHFGQYGNIEKSVDFLNTLANYSVEEPLSVRAFQVLAYGSISDRYKFWDVTNALVTTNKLENKHILHSLKGDIIKPVECAVKASCSGVINIDNVEDQKNLVTEWESYCEEGGEGFVIKPFNAINYLPGGYYIQPALKVRGAKYLNLIYGIDYQDKDYFNKVSWRNIKNKRALAAKEFELSIKLLRTFLNQNPKELQKLIAGFIGMENNFRPHIDATL